LFRSNEFFARLLLQVDPRKRPRVEDLENLPSVQQYMSQARNILNDYRMNQVFHEKSVPQIELICLFVS
jgi:hypothetical protein